MCGRSGKGEKRKRAGISWLGVSLHLLVIESHLFILSIATIWACEPELRLLFPYLSLRNFLGAV